MFTTGGTGPATRDVTPEATAAVCDRLMPGFGELMRHVSTRSTPTAIMSRQLAGLRWAALIVDLPGSPGSIEECCSRPRSTSTTTTPGSVTGSSPTDASGKLRAALDPLTTTS